MHKDQGEPKASLSYTASFRVARKKQLNPVSRKIILNFYMFILQRFFVYISFICFQAQHLKIYPLRIHDIFKKKNEVNENLTDQLLEAKG